MDNVKLRFDWLKQSHVHIKDWKKIQQKIQHLIKGKTEKLQVIADFDFTLTKFHIGGQKSLSTYGVMESYSSWPREFKEAIHILKSNYYEIDNDPLKSIGEKIPLLLVLLREAFGIMQCSGLQESNFKFMVEENSLQLREGVLDFFEELHKSSVPFLIMSAGLGNIILQVLKKHGLLKRNLKIVANHVKYRHDATEIVDEVAGRLVHPYDKGDISLCLSDSYFKNLSHCKNIILLGDSLGDLDMSCGATSANTILSIGFLNEKIEESLESYMEHYDIVLTDDQTFDIPNYLIKLVVG
ncbi:cytosolic 5'-nucleotidase 3-like [Daphnia carinata]|uniref:cytosolic 5'-nucleotidase 3-like n=1 Tax=Daphnia carinata TaxID=120202 RepID=UPI00257F39FD|nr:cytosolic 5'-nucleotidase 3-like [Daphnia carinata]